MLGVSSSGFAIPVNLLKLVSTQLLYKRYIEFRKFIIHSGDSVHSTNFTNSDFEDCYLFAIHKGQKYH